MQITSNLTKYKIMIRSYSSNNKSEMDQMQEILNQIIPRQDNKGKGNNVMDKTPIINEMSSMVPELNNIHINDENIVDKDMDNDISSIFDKDIEEVSLNPINRERNTLNIPVYIDMSDKFIISKYLLKALMIKLQNYGLSMNSNTNYNFIIILVEPAIRNTYMPDKDRIALETFIDETHIYGSKSEYFKEFPNYSRIKSHINFITKTMITWQQTINFTESKYALPKHIVNMVEEIVSKIKDKYYSKFTVKFSIIHKKIYTIKKDEIKENSIIIPKESALAIDKDDESIYKSFIDTIEKSQKSKIIVNNIKNKHKKRKDSSPKVQTPINTPNTIQSNTFSS